MCRRGCPYPLPARVKSLRYTFGAQAGAHGETKSKNSHRLTLAEQQSGTVMRPSHLLFAAFLVGAASLPAQAQDYYAITAINFFTSACVSNLAEPAAIRERANRRYQPVKDPGELANYIGNDRKGEAWRLPGRGERRFVLALASETGACTVFIESANREVVEKEFRQLVERAGQPGVTVKTESDETLPTRSGPGLMLSMSATDDKTKGGYLFTLIAGNETGALFSGKPIQISMQMVKLEAKKGGTLN